MTKIEKPRTILIVEDDPNTASLVATYPQREGFAKTRQRRRSCANDQQF
jgi:DNA-binding response OmpR family regulator